MKCQSICYNGGKVINGVGVKRRSQCKVVRSQKDDKFVLERGFRWDPALQRWVEEKRLSGKEFSIDATQITTKTGETYTVLY